MSPYSDTRGTLRSLNIFCTLYRNVSMDVHNPPSSISIRDAAGFRNVVMKMIGGLRNWSRLRAASINIIIVYSESNWMQVNILLSRSPIVGVKMEIDDHHAI